jgi:hypothetical protein
VSSIQAYKEARGKDKRVHQRSGQRPDYNYSGPQAGVWTLGQSYEKIKRKE